MLSQRHIAGEKFTVNASASVYVSVYLGAISKDMQPFILRVPGVHCFQSQAPECFCPLLCCRCRQHSTGSMSTGFRRWGNSWGLLLIPNFVFISLTFCINPCCVFRFLGLFMYVFQHWSPGILSSFSCSSTAFFFY